MVLKRKILKVRILCHRNWLKYLFEWSIEIVLFLDRDIVKGHLESNKLITALDSIGWNSSIWNSYLLLEAGKEAISKALDLVWHKNLRPVSTMDRIYREGPQGCHPGYDSEESNRVNRNLTWFPGSSENLLRLSLLL